MMFEDKEKNCWENTGKKELDSTSNKSSHIYQMVQYEKLWQIFSCLKIFLIK